MISIVAQVHRTEYMYSYWLQICLYNCASQQESRYNIYQHLSYFVYQQRSHNSTLILFKLEGKLRQIANPQSDKRREHSLKQLESTKAEDGSDDEYKEEEVSFIYYGDYCTCSKNSMCKGSNCLCFPRDKKCTSKCHNDKKNQVH